MKIYVASSWRNVYQPAVVRRFREAGHEVYDFRNANGFQWSEIDGNWQDWIPEQYIEALDHPLAVNGYHTDFDAMEWADMCVLVMPCGRSAHLEAGYFIGAKKPMYILMLDKNEPELMYKLATGIYTNIDELLAGV